MSKVRAEPQKENTREYAKASIRALEGDGNERKFQVSFSSEEPYRRWFGLEILDHSDVAVDLTRLNEIGVLLFNHNRDSVVGKVERAWVEDGRGEAIVEFDKDQESEKIYQKVKSHTLKGTSVSYAVDSWEEVSAGGKSKDGRFEGPARVAARWSPLEISVVSVPADATVGVEREFSIGIEPDLELYEKQVCINKNY